NLSNIDHREAPSSVSDSWSNHKTEKDFPSFVNLSLMPMGLAKPRPALRFLGFLSYHRQRPARHVDVFVQHFAEPATGPAQERLYGFRAELHDLGDLGVVHFFELIEQYC